MYEARYDFTMEATNFEGMGAVKMMDRLRAAACLLLVGMVANTASAVPPSYLLLRRAEAPGQHGMPGKPPAAVQPVPGYAYAYGWFGVTPRAHSARSFGYYREYTQWSFR